MCLIDSASSVAPVLPSSDSDSITVNEGAPFELSCVPSNPSVRDAQVQVEWFLAREGETLQLQNETNNFEISPPILNHR
jgi:hypothetical protein